MNTIPCLGSVCSSLVLDGRGYCARCGGPARLRKELEAAAKANRGDQKTAKVAVVSRRRSPDTLGSGWGMSFGTGGFTPDRPGVYLARKADRSARSAELRKEMRGPSGGGQKKRAA